MATRIVAPGGATHARPRTLPPALVRKLHAWELMHLRIHAAELEAETERLHAEVERLQRELACADDCAEMWRRDVERMQEAGAAVGMTVDGHLHLLEVAHG